MDTTDPTPIFSFEIFELIIDQVDYQENRHARTAELCALALVCRAFSELCQGRFLREITVATPSCAPHIRRLSERQIRLLNSKPYLVKYVRRVESWGPWINEAGSMSDNNRLVTDPTSQMILLRFTVLAQLSIEGQASYSGPETRLFGYKQLLDNYISTEHLTTLNITGIIDLPILRILGCPGLVELKITNSLFSSDWKDDDDDESHTRVLSDAISRGFRLKRLEISVTLFQESNCLHPLLVYCNELRKIDIYMEYSELASVPRIELPFPSLTYDLNHLGFRRLESIHAENADWTYFCGLADLFHGIAFPRLKNLSLKLHDDVNMSNNANIIFRHIAVLESLNLCLESTSTAHLLDLSTCTTNARHTLKSISLKWVTCSTHPESSQILTTLLGALKAVQKQNVIETITLQSSINVCTPAPAAYLEAWSKLSELLVDEHRVMFPYLRCVEVVFSIAKRSQDGMRHESDHCSVYRMMGESLKRIWDNMKTNSDSGGSMEGALECNVALV